MAQILYRNTMKTSSRIALLFTLWIAIVTGILLGIINSVFLYSWIHNETQNITQFVVLKNLQPRNPFTDTLQRQERVMAFSEVGFRPHDLPTFWGIQRIRAFDSRRWLVSKNNKHYVILDVSQNINRQLALLSVSAASRFVVVVGSFIYGRFFVRRSLCDLRGLSKKVRNRDVSKASGGLVFDHLPKDDEINSIAAAIENLEGRIQNYYGNLRRFVSNVSHELKTPLMVMRSEVDITKRTGEYETGLYNLATTISDMQNTIDTLLTLTRLQSQDILDKEIKSLSPLIEETIENLTKKYTDKNMHIDYKPTDIALDINEQLCKVMIHNIVDNARKYGPNNTTIIMGVEEEKLIVSNVGTISQDIIDNMWTPFWQADKNRVDGVGIGLSLVKEIVRLHEWHIAYTCENNFVTCTIYFSKHT